jgi:hypothetical protein
MVLDSWAHPLNSYPSQNTLKAADDYADKEKEMGNEDT